MSTIFALTILINISSGNISSECHSIFVYLSDKHKFEVHRYLLMRNKTFITSWSPVFRSMVPERDFYLSFNLIDLILQILSFYLTYRPNSFKKGELGRIYCGPSLDVVYCFKNGYYFVVFNKQYKFQIYVVYCNCYVPD